MVKSVAVVARLALGTVFPAACSDCRRHSWDRMLEAFRIDSDFSSLEIAQIDQSQVLNLG